MGAVMSHSRIADVCNGDEDFEGVLFVRLSSASLNLPLDFGFALLPMTSNRALKWGDKTTAECLRT